MSNNERMLYKTIYKFQNKHKLSYSYSIFNLVRDLGIKVIPYGEKGFLKLLKISKDGFSVYNNRNFYIFYNPFQITTRQNFTIAHELGHIVLGHHKLTGKRYIAHSNSNNILERQANIFARNILMPAYETKEMLKVKSYRELIDYYEVSKSMFKIRIKTLSYDLKWLNYVNKE